MIARDETPLQYPLPTRFARVQLTGDWYACDGASFVFLGYSDSSTPLAQQDIGWGFDPAGVIAGMLLAVEDDGGSFYLPNGSQVTVWQPPDALDGHWEPIVSGELCGSGSGSSGESEGSESSESSGSGAPCEPVPPYMQRWPNYEMNTAQVPGHDASGCFGWIQVESCGSGGTGGSTPTLAQILAAGNDAGGSAITGIKTLTLSESIASLQIDGYNDTAQNPALTPSTGILSIAGTILTLSTLTQDNGIYLSDNAGDNISVIQQDDASGNLQILAATALTTPNATLDDGAGNATFSGQVNAAAANLSALPSGTLVSPPSVNIGDLWLDTTTSSVHPQVRVRVS